MGTSLWELPRGEVIGFGAWYSRAVFQRVRLKRLSGEGHRHATSGERKLVEPRGFEPLTC